MNEELDSIDVILSGEIPTEETSKQGYNMTSENDTRKDIAAMDAFEKLPPEAQRKAMELSKKFDVNNAESIIAFGASAQQSLGKFSSSVISKVENRDLGEIGESLQNLMLSLKSADESPANTFFGKFFMKTKQKIAAKAAGYQKANESIKIIERDLDSQRLKLTESNKDLQALFEQNVAYHNALQILIAAATCKEKELKEVLIPQAKEVAKNDPNQMNAQVVRDLGDYLVRLQKRTYDLELTRQIAVQQAPQIRLIQNTNMDLSQKIQSSINTAIPLWSNQIVIAIALMQQEGALEATKIVSDTTNNLLIKNSEMLKRGAIEAAKETERGVIDLETLKTTQGNLIATIQETLAIQAEGARSREAASAEMLQLENELKGKLLQIATDYK